MTEKINQRNTLRKRTTEFKEKDVASKEISNKAINLEEYQQANSIFIYMSSHKEVDTKQIIDDALSKGKRVFVPVTKDIIYLSEIFANTKYIKGKYNIKEPSVIKEADIEPDIAFIPLVGFDKDKNRIGQGKGYYDRYLNGYKGKKIALAFSVQQTDKIFTEKCDIRMDMIITEENIF